MSLDDYLSRASASDLARLRRAAREFERTGPGAVIFAWLARPASGSDDEDGFSEAVSDVRPAAALILIPSDWLRIVSPRQAGDLRELEAAEELARAFRQALR